MNVASRDQEVGTDKPHQPQDDEDESGQQRHVQWSEDDDHSHSAQVGKDRRRSTGSMLPRRDTDTRATAIQSRSFPVRNDLASVIEVDVVTDLGESMYQFSRLTRAPSSISRIISYDGSDGLLQERLVLAIEATSREMNGPEKAGFLPKAQLIKLMDEASVVKELNRIERSFRKRIQIWRSCPSPGVIEKEARAICSNLPMSPPTSPTGTYKDPREKESFRKIFAMLLLIGRPGVIRNFMAEGLCDADLPLKKVPRKKNPKAFSLCRTGTQDCKLDCLSGWRRTTLARLEESQWKLLAPFFSQGEDQSLKHYHLDSGVILPFTYRQRVHRGAHADIYKVKIHPEHHGFNIESQLTNEFFAIKSLLGGEDSFRQEFGMLKRVANSHEHVISLLATYEHCGQYHFIFPWADCDLEGYWKKNRVADYDLDTVLWMARQCEGVAIALDQVHHHMTYAESSIFAKGSASTRLLAPPPASMRQDRQRRLAFGRHGDIKATNLLWFPNPGKIGDKGIIKISDFGAGEFSKTVAAPSQSGSVSYTPRYRPPECDLPGSQINNAYDIWTLGCLYLEFITWVIGGWALLDEFAELRRKTTIGWRHTNAFFEIRNEGEQDCEQQRARVKPTVKEFILRLRRDAKCSTFLGEFLDLIQDSMLMVQAEIGEFGKRRITCSKVYRELGEMIGKCEEDSTYAINTLTSSVTSEQPVAGG